jgi:SAM-dependent methyltransferase
MSPREEGGPDLAGQAYWERLWTRSVGADPGLAGQVERRFATLFRRALPPPPARVLEVGAARSAWLPWFASEGHAVNGLDYSPTGCQQARDLLRSKGMRGDVVCANFFDPPPERLGSQDAVVSIGLIEHFDDTAGCVRALGRFLRPGGTMITIIPNLVGAVGWLQRLLNVEVWRIHVPLDRRSVLAAHADGGLTVETCEYFLPANFGVVNLNGLDTDSRSYRPKAAFLRGLRLGSEAALRAEAMLNRRLPATKALAPYIVCIARR